MTNDRVASECGAVEEQNVLVMSSEVGTSLPGTDRPSDLEIPAAEALNLSRAQ